MQSGDPLAVSTDGKQMVVFNNLSRKNLKIEDKIINIKDIKRINLDKDEILKIFEYRTKIVLQTNTQNIFCVPVNVQFPNFRDVIPNDFKIKKLIKKSY